MNPKTFEGTPCSRCGSTTRYLKGHGCVACKKACSQKWLHAHPERAREQDRLRKAQNREKRHIYDRERYAQDPKRWIRASRDHDLKKKFGLTREQYDQMLLDSCGLCALCQKPFNNVPHDPAIDHNHQTGEIRGLVHGVCNRVLGLFNDDPQILELAIKYLRGSNDSA